MLPTKDLGIAFAADNSAEIREDWLIVLPLLVFLAKMAVEVVFAAALRRAIRFRTSKLTGLLGNVATGMQLVGSTSTWEY